MYEALKAKWAKVGNFSTDGCTASPDLFWKECCEEHDFYYKNPEFRMMTRAQADRRLYECMRKRGTGRLLAGIYWLAVRSIGWRFWKKKK